MSNFRADNFVANNFRVDGGSSFPTTPIIADLGDMIVVKEADLETMTVRFDT